jgi:hypothetical protein
VAAVIARLLGLRWMWAALAALALLLVAYALGRIDERQAAAQRAAEDRLETLQEVQRHEDDARDLSDDDLADSISR